jgi:hypothetical protein
MKIISKILKHLYVLQIVSNEERVKQGLPRLGRGYFDAYRFNPYNPLSYIIVIIYLIVGVVMFGFVGILKNDLDNPFKWN